MNNKTNKQSKQLDLCQQIPGRGPDWTELPGLRAFGFGRGQNYDLWWQRVCDAIHGHNI